MATDLALFGSVKMLGVMKPHVHQGPRLSPTQVVAELRKVFGNV